MSKVCPQDIQVYGCIQTTYTDEFCNEQLAEKWQRFKRQFSVYYAACGLQVKSKATQVGILLHMTGAEAQYVHESITFKPDDID